MLLRRAATAFVLGSLFVAACGSDDDSAEVPDAAAGGDASRDAASTDARPSTDGSSGNPFDAGRTDATNATDAGADADADADVTDAGADADATPPVDAGDAGPTAAFCAKYTELSYSSITTCCPGDGNAPAILFLKVFGQLIVPQCSSRLAQSIANGRVVYDPAKEASCYAAIETTSAECPAVGPGARKTSPDCELAYRGTVPEGGTCDGDIECANGLPCQGTVCTKATTTPGGACRYPDGSADPGIFSDRERCIAGEVCYGGSEVCAPLAQQDDDCFFDDDCADGLYCAGVGFDTTCQPIVEGDVGATCQSEVNCKPDHYCARANEGDDFGTCAARKTAGASCTDTHVNGTECRGYCDEPTLKCVSFCGSN